VNEKKICKWVAVNVSKIIDTPPSATSERYKLAPNREARHNSNGELAAWDYARQHRRAL
jgi:hypothetical protein